MPDVSKQIKLADGSWKRVFFAKEPSHQDIDAAAAHYNAQLKPVAPYPVKPGSVQPVGHVSPWASSDPTIFPHSIPGQGGPVMHRGPSLLEQALANSRKPSAAPAGKTGEHVTAKEIGQRYVAKYGRAKAAPIHPREGQGFPGGKTKDSWHDLRDIRDAAHTWVMNALKPAEPYLADIFPGMSTLHLMDFLRGAKQPNPISGYLGHGAANAIAMVPDIPLSVPANMEKVMDPHSSGLERLGGGAEIALTLGGGPIGKVAGKAGGAALGLIGRDLPLLAEGGLNAVRAGRAIEQTTASGIGAGMREAGPVAAALGHGSPVVHEPAPVNVGAPYPSPGGGYSHIPGHAPAVRPDPTPTVAGSTPDELHAAFQAREALVRKARAMGADPNYGTMHADEFVTQNWAAVAKKDLAEMDAVMARLGPKHPQYEQIKAVRGKLAYDLKTGQRPPGIVKDLRDLHAELTGGAEPRTWKSGSVPAPQPLGPPAPPALGAPPAAKPAVLPAQTPVSAPAAPGPAQTHVQGVEAPQGPPSPPVATAAPAPAVPPVQPSAQVPGMRMEDIERLAAAQGVTLPPREDLARHWGEVQATALENRARIEKSLDGAVLEPNPSLSAEEHFVGHLQLREANAAADQLAAKMAAETDPQMKDALAGQLDEALRKSEGISRMLYKSNSNKGRELGFLRSQVGDSFDDAVNLVKAEKISGGTLTNASRTRIIGLSKSGQAARLTLEQKLQNEAEKALSRLEKLGIDKVTVKEMEGC